MTDRDIKIKLNKAITEMKVFNKENFIISINGVYFWTDRIVYDEEHCWCYLKGILVGFVNFNDIHYIDTY